MNHSSKLHPWFLSATKSLSIEPCGIEVCSEVDLCRDHNIYVDYYHFTTEKGLPNYHQVQGSPNYYYEGAFGDHMPDLNLDNESLRSELIDIGIFWMDKGVDGFRLDAVTHFYDNNITKNQEFLAWLKDSLAEHNPDVYIVGEAWTDGGTIEKLYESGVTSFFNFPFSGGTGDIIKNIKTKKNGKEMTADIVRWQSALNAISPSAIDAVFLSNHDNARSGGALNKDLVLQKMGASVYMLMPGNSFIYYGEEVGMLGSGKDENKRQPMIWSIENPEGITTPPPYSEEDRVVEYGVMEQLDDEESLLRHYMKLLKLKRQHPEIARGVITGIEVDNDGICAYKSTWDNDGVIEEITIIHNLTDEPYELMLENVACQSLVDSLENSGVEIVENDGSVVLPGKSTILCQ